MNLFPYSKVRKSQESFMNALDESLKSGSNLLAHVPTGTGKTGAVLSKALETALEKNLTVFFLTPRHTQHLIVIDTLKQIKDKFSLSISVCDFIGKKWLCLIPASDSLNSGDFGEFCRELKKDEKCPYYNNFRKGDKISEDGRRAVDFIRSNPLHSEECLKYCAGRGLCAYEVLCEAAKKARVVVGDYFHLFSPGVRSSLLAKMNKSLDESIIIVDEAHNLPSRLREILSSQLSSFILNAAVKEARKFKYFELAESLSFISIVFDEFKERLTDDNEVLVSKDLFVKLVSDKTQKDFNDLSADLISAGDEIRKERKKSFCGSVGRFLDEWLGEDDGFVRLFSKSFTSDGKVKFSFSYRCLDPSLASYEVFSQSYASVLMSGTLTPISMYADVLGVEKERLRTVELGTDFPSENRLAIITPRTTTKYSARNPEMFRQIAVEISSIVNSVKGNSACFFPSYRLRDLVLSHFERLVNKTILLEKQEMSKSERIEVFNKFDEYKSSGAVLMGVISGSLAEGIDYPGKLLECLVVIGVPLERPDLFTKSLIKYYDQKFKAGWAYGYIYPGMNRALQAAGRVIRSETDRGVIVFLDERFTWSNYLSCFPPDWNLKITNHPDLLIKKFFNESEPKP